MPAPIVVRLQVDGVDGIRRAFQSVEDIVTRTERGSTTAAARGARARVTEAEREAKAKKTAAEKTALDQIAIWKKTDTVQRQAQDHAIREVERGEQAKRRIIEREAREVVNIEAAMYAKRKREHDKFTHALSGAVKRGAHSGASAVTGMMGAALSLGGGFGIADSMHRSMELSTLATDIAIQGHVTGPGGSEANKRQRSGKEIEGAIRATSIETGMESGDVGKGLMKFTNLTGDLQLGLDLLPQLAKMAAATGTSFDDMAQSAGNISKALEGTKDPAKGTMDILQSMAGQGRENSIELKDFAVQVAKITATSGKFEGTSVENVIKMSSLMQDARGGGGAWNSASAATAVSSFGATFGKGARRKEFKARGIELEGKDNKVRDPFEIIAESIDKTHGNIEGLNKLYGSVMVDRAIRKHVGVYGEAEKKKKGSGKQAVLDRMHENAGVKLSDDEINTGFKMKMETDAAKIQKTRAEFDKVINDQLMPVLPQLVKELSKLIPYVGDAAKAVARFAQMFADNPVAGIGIIIGAAIAKEMAAAAIGKGIEKALSTSLGQGGLIVGTAAMAIAVGIMKIDEDFSKEAKTVSDAANDSVAGDRIIRDLMGGDKSAGKKAEGAAMLAKLQGDLTAENNRYDNPSATKAITGAIGSVVSPEAMAAEQASHQKTQEDLIKTIADLTTAMNLNTTATHGSSKDGGKSGGAGVPPANRKDSLSPSEPRR